MAYTTINKSSDYFNTKLYSGTGSSNAVTGVGFQPDWVWVKNRTGTNNHRMANAVSGSSEVHSSNITNVGADSSYFSSFNSDGFTIGTAADTNVNGGSFASWNWKEGVNSGFDIVAYTGNGSARTISHSLNKIPTMIMIKDLSAATDWTIYHVGVGNTKRLVLNSTQAQEDDASFFNDTTPTSSVFSVGSSSGVNLTGRNYIAYVFTDIVGYSKLGSYTGNGNTDGAFIYTGFAPKYIMVKDTTSVRNWHVFDTERDGYGKKNHDLKPNLSSAELSVDGVHWYDYLSNGFKVRMPTSNADYSDINASGNKYIYMAFAEAPLVGSNNVPATAR